MQSQPAHETSDMRAVWRDALVTGIVPAAALLLGLLWIGPHTSWFRLTSPPNQALPATHRASLPLNESVMLIGYDLAPTVARPGQEVHVRLYWQASEALGRDYASFVKLVAGVQREEFAQSNHPHPGNIPTATWPTARYVVDDHYVALPADMPALALRVLVGLYRPDTLEWFGAASLPELVHVVRQVDLRQAQISRESAARFGASIRLLGHHVEEGEHGLQLTLFWQATASPERDYQVFVHALDAAGALATQADGPPTGGLYPTSAWLPGQVIVDTRLVPCTARNVATLRVGLYDLSNMARLPVQLEGELTSSRDAVTIPIHP